MFPGQCGNTAFFFKSQPDQFHFEFRGIVFPGKSFFSAHEVSTCKISGCLSYRILDSGPDGTQTTLTVQEFEKLLKRHNCRGLFCHTGKTGAGSKSVSIASERMEIISGQRLIDLLTPGSSFTIATAPQTMMKRTAATLETSTIVKGTVANSRW